MSTEQFDPEQSQNQGNQPYPPAGESPNFPPPQPPLPPTAVPFTEEVVVVPIPEVNVTFGFNYAWAKVRQNLGTLILAALTFAGVGLILGLVFGAMVSASRSTAATAFSTFVLVLVLIVYWVLTQANILNGLLKLVGGQTVEYRDFFQFRNVLPVLLAGLIIGISSGLLFFTMAGPVVIAFLTTFTVILIVDRDYGAWDAIVGSARIVWNNIGTVAVFQIGSVIALYVGTMFFGIGVLLAIPVILVAQVWLYKVLTEENVAF